MMKPEILAHTIATNIDWNIKDDKVDPEINIEISAKFIKHHFVKDEILNKNYERQINQYIMELINNN